jgi:hypothetical protein
VSWFLELGELDLMLELGELELGELDYLELDELVLGLNVLELAGASSTSFPL